MRTIVAGMALVATALGPVSGLAQGAGFIEGRLSYPSDGIPRDLRVCADNLDVRGTTCTNRHMRLPNGWGYRLAVPAGRYHVWASTREMPGYRAYYSDYVRCGSHVSCPSHRPIEVEVRPGETTRSIDPGDWYK